jgi:hypothetical protein
MISHDCSGNPLDLESGFFLLKKSDQRKLLFLLRKNHFLNERLKRKAGLAPKKMPSDYD